MKNKLYYHNTLYLLLALLVAVNTTAQSSCDYVIIDLTQPSEKIDIQCEKINVLQIRLWNYSGPAFSLPPSKKYQLVAVEGGSIMNEFLKLNGNKMDTLYYHENDNNKNIYLDKIKLNYLSIFVEYKAKLNVGKAVSIKHLTIRGIRLNVKSAKQIINIHSLSEITCFEYEITKKAKEIFEQNSIIVSKFKK